MVTNSLQRHSMVFSVLTKEVSASKEVRISDEGDSGPFLYICFRMAWTAISSDNTLLMTTVAHKSFLLEDFKFSCLTNSCSCLQEVKLAFSSA